MAQVAVAAIAGAVLGKVLSGKGGKKGDAVFPVDAYQNYDHDEDVKTVTHLAQIFPEVRESSRARSITSNTFNHTSNTP